MTDKQPEALIRADELEAIGGDSSLARTMAAHTIRLLYKENEALRARLAQPEPEPWGYISHKSWKMPVFVEADNLEVSGLPFNNPNYTPVYKTPPQREWQGLTDEEIENCFEMSMFGTCRAIEAKLKEKNT